LRFCTEIGSSGRPGEIRACLTAGRYRPEHKKSDTPGYGNFTLITYLVPYSNNLVAIAEQKNIEPGKFNAALTPAGYLAAGGDLSLENYEHYGSYHPFTGEVVVGSSLPVNFI